ncbi:MAG: hypothetical protein C4324_03870 [Blastocatellia bacterium]
MKPLAQNTLIQNRYLIVQLIGKGGMGEVYLAVDQRLGSAVAIKRTFFAGDETLGNAFEREARVLARLRHPVLPKVSDHFIENDQQFLVMEHISGEDLGKRLELLGKPFPLSWVMFWADQLLDALAYLHSHEPPIIHRDIKPQNLKLTDENHIILLDFGLSKSSTGQTNISGGKSGSGSTGSVVGYTPHYAPMEQIRGIGTSARSDIYSLSATLYHMMTNCVPIDALSRADTMLNGLPDPLKSPKDLNPEIPPTIAAVILKGMEVSQDRRYESAKEMQRLLRKAYSEMQQAMSAKTVVISGSEHSTHAVVTDDAFQPTEVLEAESMRAISNPVGEARPVSGFSESISQPSDAGSINSASPAADTGGIRQADVKTEVLLADTGGPPAAADQSQTRVNEPFGSHDSEPDAGGNDPGSFAATTNYAAISGDTGLQSQTPAGEYSPAATMPFVGINDSAANADNASASPGFVATPPPETSAPAPDLRKISAKDQTVKDRPKPAAAGKSSTVKYIAILAGVFFVLLIVLAAVGGGIYYYTTYFHSGMQAEPTPYPTPEETPEPTPYPSPEATPQIAIAEQNANSNSDSSTQNTNTNSENVAPIPEPTPAFPKSDRTLPLAEPKQERTPRPQVSKAPKASPTKKPGTGPDILQ